MTSLVQGLSGNLWPAHPKPLPDELVSSWIVRLARANHLPLHTFCHLEWPGKAIWNRDIDKSADVDLLAGLATRTATPFHRVSETTLKDHIGRIHERFNALGNTPWVMPVGVYHRVRMNRGLGYCPSCLREDDIPYFRRQWRLAFHVTCPEHGAHLRDECPVCRSPVLFHRVRSVDAPLSVCGGCGFDLRQAESAAWLGGEMIIRRARDLQVRLADAQREGWIEITGLGVIPSIAFFAGMRALLVHVGIARRLGRFRGALRDELGLRTQVDTSQAPIKRFERLNARQRIEAMACVQWMLEGWPERLWDIARQSGVRASDLLRDFERPPFWYEQAVREGLGVAATSAKHAERRGAQEWLARAESETDYPDEVFGRARACSVSTGAGPYQREPVWPSSSRRPQRIRWQDIDEGRVCRHSIVYWIRTRLAAGYTQKSVNRDLSAVYGLLRSTGKAPWRWCIDDIALWLHMLEERRSRSHGTCMHYLCVIRSVLRILPKNQRLVRVVRRRFEQDLPGRCGTLVRAFPVRRICDWEAPVPEPGGYGSVATPSAVPPKQPAFDDISDSRPGKAVSEPFERPKRLPAVHNRCDYCGCAMAKATKLYRNKAYCRRCYNRLFETVLCAGGCGRATRAPRGVTEALCRSCRVQGRRCVRCGRLTPRAGLLTDAGAACPSCARYFRDPSVGTI
ncbi:TniQ family protein [Thioalkalivibrio sp. ALJ24]|uniref:TniQ family protein n=1 Tax=Thioalkalivibrio sp. ALJ24 TaxID=545276 RepID=UPI00039B0ED3